MPLPTKLSSLYTAESGRVTAPDETMHSLGTSAAMQQRAVFTTPSRSTAAASPPFADADAAKITALSDAGVMRVPKLLVLVTSTAATLRRLREGIDNELESNEPERVVAMHGRPFQSSACTHALPVPPPAPSTSTGFCAAPDASEGSMLFCTRPPTTKPLSIARLVKAVDSALTTVAT
eukprot:2864939-Pleurochrysis_carterae.AAC.4